jgi:tetratricopeptide (TPR) repeat protein
MSNNNDLNQLLAQATRHLDARQWEKADRLLRRAAKLSPNNTGIMQRLAAVQARLGQFRKALDTINAALVVQPTDLLLHTTRVDILARSAQVIPAIESLTMTMSDFPDRSDLHAMRSGLLLHIGETNAAWDDMQRACQLDPDNLELLGKFIDSTIARGIIPMDREPADRLLALQPFEARNHSRLGTLLRMNGCSEEAMEAYAKALRGNPRDTDAIAGQAELLESSGDSTAALELLRPNIESDRAAFLPLLAWSRIQGRLGNHERVVDDGRRWLQAIDRPPLQASPVLFRIGNALDAMGRHDEAFDAWTQANTPFRDRWNPEAHERNTDSIIEHFTAERINASNPTHAPAPTPIFIVGMFRSGTTLLEQVLTAHHQVHGVGESPALPAIIRSLPAPYPACIDERDADSLNEMATRYLKAVSADAGGATHITDKLPMNFLNVGLITMLFPGARILHCRRDALDVCLSCYSNQMTSNLAFTSGQGSMGRAYRDYDRVMQHWSNSSCPILDVKYEQLVAEPEPGVRAILDFLDLPWDPSCLDFHQSSRVAQTPSMDQVRQPMHTRSVHRSRAYWSHLEPLRTALGDLAPPREP